jgi:hypothetical protein
VTALGLAGISPRFWNFSQTKTGEGSGKRQLKLAGLFLPDMTLNCRMGRWYSPCVSEMKIRIPELTLTMISI